jgi:hypothetical protein
MDEGEIDAINKIVNKKTSEIFSRYQNLDYPMDWVTAKHQAAGELLSYITIKFMDIPEPDYGEYADLGTDADAPETPSGDDSPSGDFDYNAGGFPYSDPGDQIPAGAEEEEEEDDPAQYDEMKFSDFLKTFDFYQPDSNQATEPSQEEPESEQV